MIYIAKLGFWPNKIKVIRSALKAAAKAVNQIRGLKVIVISSTMNNTPANGALNAAAKPAATPAKSNVC